MIVRSSFPFTTEKENRKNRKKNRISTNTKIIRNISAWTLSKEHTYKYARTAHISNIMRDKIDIIVSQLLIKYNREQINKMKTTEKPKRHESGKRQSARKRRQMKKEKNGDKVLDVTLWHAFNSTPKYTNCTVLLYFSHRTIKRE